jgi:hypothetical protein
VPDSTGGFSVLSFGIAIFTFENRNMVSHLSKLKVANDTTTQATQRRFAARFKSDHPGLGKDGER